MTITELRRQLRKICHFKTQKALAKEFGISLSYLNEVIGGRKEPGPKLLNAMGLRRQMVYVLKTGNAPRRLDFESEWME